MRTENSERFVKFTEFLAAGVAATIFWAMSSVTLSHAEHVIFWGGVRLRCLGSSSY